LTKLRNRERSADALLETLRRGVIAGKAVLLASLSG
jgi:hypothetical protein